MEAFIQTIFYSTASKRTVPWNLIEGVALIGHGSSIKSFFLCMIIVMCGSLTFKFEVIM